MAGLKRFIRVSWTLGTYLLAFPALVVAALVGTVAGLVRGLAAPRQFWYRFRVELLRILLTVLRPCLNLSTRVYGALMGSMPPPQFPLPQAAHAFYVVGHRGSPTDCCENTLHSYATALRHGANALEIDLCLTADGEVVIWHDWDPDDMVALFREGGLEALQRYRPVYGAAPYRRPVPKLTLAELRTHCCYEPRTGGPADAKELLHIPTYREFLAWAATQKGLKRVFLDMKIPPTCVDHVQPMLSRMIADYEAICPGFDVVFMTIFPEVMAAMKQQFPDQRYCFDKEIHNTFSTVTDEMLAQHSPTMAAEALRHTIGSVGRPTFLMLGPWEVYAALVAHDLTYRQARGLDVALIAWTINEPEEQRWLIEAGVDGILTDDPGALARRLVARRLLATLGSPVRALRRRRKA